MVQLPIIGLQHEHEANPCIYEYKTGDESSEDLLYYSDSMPMQYTWLKDKNGKEIYEGDIVNQWTNPWKKEASIRKRFEIQWECKGGRTGYCLSESVSYEVIWNIYENPELITKTTNEQ